MTSGLDLLADARSRDAAGLWALAGHGATDVSDSDTRPGLVTALMSDYSDADAPLVRELTRHEMAMVRADPDWGCGDGLLACCWLLFMLGRVEDTALIWEAKRLNFDTGSHIEAVFLIPAGVEATETFARRAGLTELVEYVSAEWMRNRDDEIAAWRQGAYFGSPPGPERPVTELAEWLRK